MRISFQTGLFRSAAVVSTLSLSLGGITVPAFANPVVTITGTIGQLEQLREPMDIGENTGEVFASYAGGKTFVIKGTGKLDKAKFNLTIDKDNSTFASKVRSAVGADAENYIIKIEPGVQFPDDSSALFQGLPFGLDIDPSIDTSNVTNMSFMFANTTKANPNVAGWKTTNVTDMSNMFSGAESANPDTRNWDTSNVENMKAMFFGASVANPNTSSWNTSKVTNLNSMFFAAPVANPDTTKWDIENVINMGSLFTMSGVSVIDIRNWNTSLSEHSPSSPFNSLSAKKFERYVFDTVRPIGQLFLLFNSVSWDEETDLYISHITDPEAYAKNPNDGKTLVKKVTGKNVSKEDYRSLFHFLKAYEVAPVPKGGAFIDANDVVLAYGAKIDNAELTRQANVRAGDGEGRHLPVSAPSTTIDTQKAGSYQVTFTANNGDKDTLTKTITVTVTPAGTPETTDIEPVDGKDNGADNPETSPVPGGTTPEAPSTETSSAPTTATSSPTTTTSSPTTTTSAAAPSGGRPGGEPTSAGANPNGNGTAARPSTGTTVPSEAPTPTAPSEAPTSEPEADANDKEATTEPTAEPKANRFGIIGAILAGLLGVGALAGILGWLSTSGAISIPGFAVPGALPWTR